MAKRRQPRRQGHNSTPLWTWLLVGLFVGALGYFGYRQYLLMTDSPPEIPTLGQAAHDDKDSRQAHGPAASAEQDGVLDTDYSFYDVLPTEESMDIPVTGGQAPETPSAAPSTTPETKPIADTSRYLLQAGSFERAADADDLKARIALSGEAAHVETAEVNGKTMHRVRLGPYADIKAANAAKANLAGQGINAVSIKIQ